MSYSIAGKHLRLKRILPTGRGVVFAFDHGVEHGPGDFPREYLDPRVIIGKVVEAGVDAVMMLPGAAFITRDLWAGRASLIVKVTSKTNLRPEDGRLLQSVFGHVEDAVALGAEAVAATVYWGSQYEDAMLRQWFEVKRQAERYGYPCLQLSYPRGPAIKNMYDVEVVKYGVRAAIESGADLIKTYYTGSLESFREVVEAAAGIPVLMSGGAVRERFIDFLRDVENVVKAGGRGVVVGRNVFRHRNPAGAMKAVMKVVHEDASPEEAVKYAEQ
ncbi:class I fructose-bisphosphate aldolase [Desulfurococcus mucosus]|uniref:fructose-bisphosphate aldolase n=1 Tax=Desulfurococcus mucosus (strain ATCC 35584 / DSM 2162 / JCM 9187 / O7/1) TaxID=765177 RepID=E8R851_DESM0|nr:class I fructose-bisphosphate aldolase [Desulfurococcus mucosus]ADV64677.1 fructose-bisphosphate aldolase [Desulfurococcus mucosus DSM 2162]